MTSKIAIIGTVGVPACYGGFETLAENLIKNLAGQYEFFVYCSSKAYSKKENERYGAKLIYLPFSANGYQSVFYDTFSILSAIRKADILLVLGVSAGLSLLFLKPFLKKKKIIVNIDGQEWTRPKWGRFSRWFLKISEKIAVRFANVVITDNKIIQDNVLSQYGVFSHLITYGADHVVTSSPSGCDSPLFSKLPLRFALSICRIEPENNIELILRAFKKNNDLPLVIVGNWTTEYGVRLKKQYGDCHHIYLINPIYEQNKLNYLRRRCVIYVHGHSVGGTNPSLIEAMYYGLPIACFDVNYNKETTAHKAMYFHHGDDLLNIIRSIEDKALAVYAEQMKKIAEKKHTWRLISQQYADLF